MDEFLKMDIFFAVTTVVTIVVGGLVAYALVRAIKILKQIEEIALMAKAEGQQLREDIQDMRDQVRAGKIRLGQLLGLAGMMKGSRRRARPKGSPKSTNE